MTDKIAVDLNVGTVTSMIEDETLHPRRLPNSPVGIAGVVCKPCGHSWYEHDDLG